MNTFRVTAAILFSLAILSPAGCVLSDVPEGDEPMSLELEPSTNEAVAAESAADELASTPLVDITREDHGTEACQPGSYVGPCADWGASAIVHSQCGSGYHAWKYWRCKQYRDPSGKLYREQCGSEQIWCDFNPQPPGTNDCYHSC